jgi:hypothetical protein
LYGIARCIDRVEERLLPVEIGAIERIADRDDPPGVPATRADVKLQCEHRFPLKQRRRPSGFTV